MDNQGGDEAPLTEPLIVPCVIVTGVGIETDRQIVRFVGWASMPTLPGSEMNERRVVVRFAMPSDSARQLMTDLSNKLYRGQM